MWREHYHRTHRGKVTRGIVAETLTDAWNQITGETIESGWEIFGPCWGTGETADDEGCDLDDDAYRQFIDVQDLRDL
jgi:hypothetical protein